MARTNRLFLTILLLCLAAPSHSTPDVTHGNGLLAVCTANDEYNRLFCVAYIQGISDGFRIGAIQGATAAVMTLTDAASIDEARSSVKKTMEHNPGCRLINPWSEPDGAIYGQKVDIVIKWLKNNPDLRNLASPFVVSSALRSAWPTACE